MSKSTVWKSICMAGLTVFIGSSLVACENKPEQVQTKDEIEVVQDNQEEEVVEEDVFFKEKPVEIDYTKPAEEILVNYTEQGMNQFKVNFPDTLSMNYALKHIGDQAPEIKGKTMDGKKISLSSLKGKKVIINFSKTTCSFCKEMTSVTKEIEKLNKDIVFLTVFPVDVNKDIKAYYKGLKQDVPENTLSLEMNKNLKDIAVDKYNIAQVPTYVFVDESGRISYTYIGNKDVTMFQDMIETAFEEEKLYDNVRMVTVRVDKDGNEIVEEKLIDEDSINADGVDHIKTETEDEKKSKSEKSKENKNEKSENNTKDKSRDHDEKK